MKFLLVNPWIADTSAYNFWLRPLGLYRLAEWLHERGAEVSLLDCLSPFPAPGKFKKQKLAPSALPEGVPKAFGFYGIGEGEFLRRLEGAGRIDAVLVTSALSYWYPRALRAIELARSRLPGVPVVLGGVYPTLWPAHAEEMSGADYVIRGPLAKNSPKLAEILGLPEEPVREAKKWYELSLHDGAAYGAIRTAEGCPFSCTYCASNLLSEKYKPRKVSDCVEELSALAGFGVREIAFYDDALLVDAKNRFLPLMREVKKRKLPLAFHTPNGLHARFLDSEVAEAMAENNFLTIRLSLETVNEERQSQSGGKVTAPITKAAVENLLKAGIPPERIGVYLLMGLPGQTSEEVEESIRFVKGLGVRPWLAEYSPIPGTPDFDKVLASGLLPPDIDPLWTNNSLYFWKYSGLPVEEAQRLKRLSRM